MPPAQPPLKPHARISSRPFQQSQSSQHVVYACKTDNSGAEHSNCLQEDKSNQVLLPAIHNKVPQQVNVHLAKEKLSDTLPDFFFPCVSFSCSHSRFLYFTKRTVSGTKKWFQCSSFLLESGSSSIEI